jgi:hypothetical protein
MCAWRGSEDGVREGSRERDRWMGRRRVLGVVPGGRQGRGADSRTFEGPSHFANPRLRPYVLGNEAEEVWGVRIGRRTEGGEGP